MSSAPTMPQVDWQNDPDFAGLPLAEKDKVLNKVDPDYASLPTQEKAKALNVIHYGAKGTQYEQNRTPPDSGFWRGAKAFGQDALGAVEGLGEMAFNSSPTAAAARAVQTGSDIVSGDLERKAAGRGPLYRGAAALGEATGIVNPRPMEEAAERGDTASILGHAALPTAAAGLAATHAIGGPEAFEPATALARKVAAPARSAIEAVSPAIDRLRVPEAPRALRQAIQPSVNIPRAGESIDIAGPRLQQLRQSGQLVGQNGEPITEFKTPQDLLEGIKSAKGHIWDQIESRLGPVDTARADTTPVADAMEKSISGRTGRQRGAMADAIKERADTYRGSMPLREIEESIEDANNELRDFYKRPNASDSPIGPQMRAIESEVKTLRSLLDSKVQDLRGAGLNDLKREYGALRDVERATARANAVATRQKGATLWEGLAALRAAGDFVSGNVLGAAKGAGTLAIGRWLSKLRDPNFLIDQAFQGKKSFAPASAIKNAPIDVVQGEYTAPIQPGRVQPPHAGIEPRNLLPGRNASPLLPGRTTDMEPVVTPERLGQPLLKPGRLPRKVVGLLPEQNANELPSSGETITPGARRALPSVNPIDLIEPGTPKYGIRTIGGKIVASDTGTRIAEVPGARQAIAAPPKTTAATSGPELMQSRLRLTELDKKYSDWTDRLGRSRSFGTSKRLITKLRGISDERNGLREKFGMAQGEEPAEATNPMATYASLSPEDRQVVDSWAKQVPQLPQIMREEEMRDLSRYGEPYTSLKEKIAKRMKANPGASGIRPGVPETVVPERVEREPGAEGPEDYLNPTRDVAQSAQREVDRRRGVMLRRNRNRYE